MKLKGGVDYIADAVSFCRQGKKRESCRSPKKAELIDQRKKHPGPMLSEKHISGWGKERERGKITSRLKAKKKKKVSNSSKGRRATQGSGSEERKKGKGHSSPNRELCHKSLSKGLSPHKAKTAGGGRELLRAERAAFAAGTGTRRCGLPDRAREKQTGGLLSSIEGKRARHSSPGTSPLPEGGGRKKKEVLLADEPRGKRGKKRLLSHTTEGKRGKKSSNLAKGLRRKERSSGVA